MRTLRHANVVTFFGAGSDERGVPFLVCELMTASLQKRLWNPPEPMSEHQQLRWARDAAAGMAFLHAKGLIHRDLKSGNLLGMVTTKIII
nr:protein kinase [Nitrosomonas nitrosa]